MLIERSFVDGDGTAFGSKVHVGGGRIALQLFRRGHGENGNADAACAGEAREHVAVAAVVATATDDLPAFCIRKPFERFIERRLTGSHHQRVAADPGVVDGNLVDGAHAGD